MKTLVIGTDYAALFNLPAGAKMVFNGGNSWTGVKPNGDTKTLESEKQTQAALEYLNRQSYTMMP